MSTRPSLASLLAAAALLSASAPSVPARAEEPEARVRGVVEAADADRLTIRRGDGATLALRMHPRTRVFAATAGDLRQIKPESYLGILSRSGSEPSRADAVTLFSPSERGFEAGRRTWEPAGTTFTGGWIADIEETGGLRVTIGNADGRTVFEIPRGTPLSQIAPGEKSLLVPGAAVTAVTRPGGDGSPEASAVFVGRSGIVPTL